jgi:hypothetical protein
MGSKEILLIKDGNVVGHHAQSGLFSRTFYRKGDAVRADWYDTKSIQIHLKNGSVVLYSIQGTFLRKIG